MDEDSTPRPECFGSLELVFPMEKDGLRNTPIACRACVFRTECLRAAMESQDGLAVKEETVDRAYRSGMMNFFERWSKKKSIHRKRQASGEAPPKADRS